MIRLLIFIKNKYQESNVEVNGFSSITSHSVGIAVNIKILKFTILIKSS